MISESDEICLNRTEGGGNTGSVVHTPLNIADSCALPSDLSQMTAKIDSLKKWTVSTYKSTKQIICENLGKVERTVDKEMEDKVNNLKDLHRCYNQLLLLSKLFTKHFQHLNEVQNGLADYFTQLSLIDTNLKEDFTINSDSLRSATNHGELLAIAMDSFTSSLQTLCERSIEDTMMTIHSYDQARLEYDIYRNDVATVQSQASSNSYAVTVAEEKCAFYKKKYEHLKADVMIKMTFLNENREKVVRNQLDLLHGAFLSYFSEKLY